MAQQDDDDTSTRFIDCRTCNGDGRIYWFHGDETGTQCPTCHGTTVEEIEAQPVTLEELEEVDGC